MQRGTRDCGRHDVGVPGKQVRQCVFQAVDQSFIQGDPDQRRDHTLGHRLHGPVRVLISPVVLLEDDLVVDGNQDRSYVLELGADLGVFRELR